MRLSAVLCAALTSRGDACCSTRADGAAQMVHRRQVLLYKSFFLCYRHGWNMHAEAVQGRPGEFLQPSSFPTVHFSIQCILKGCPCVWPTADNIAELNMCRGPVSGYCPTGLSEPPLLQTGSRSSSFLGLTHLQVIGSHVYCAAADLWFHVPDALSPEEQCWPPKIGQLLGLLHLTSGLNRVCLYWWTK